MSLIGRLSTSNESPPLSSLMTSASKNSALCHLPDIYSREVGFLAKAIFEIIWSLLKLQRRPMTVCIESLPFSVKGVTSRRRFWVKVPCGPILGTYKVEIR